MINDLLISIIMCCNNSGKTLKRSLDSIRAQNYKNIEIIVQDNLSSDNTLQIFSEYKDLDIDIISEADFGIYDALNRATVRCSGDIVCVLHSDDKFHSQDVLKLVNNEFRKGAIQFLYGNIDIMTDNHTMVHRNWVAGDYRVSALKFGWMPPHTSVFVGCALSKKFMYDTSYKISGDYDWLLKILKTLSSDEVFYLNMKLISMSAGGASNGNFKKLVLRKCEDVKALRNNGYSFPVLISIIKLLRKLRQYKFFNNI